MKSLHELVTLAQDTLRKNDKGGYTIPTEGLYPFQWNWDSGICALGWQTFDEPRAWQELHYLTKGQWDNGMIPHIIFHGPSDQYFPGPDQWGLQNRTPPTTSISQPPLLATVVRILAERAKDKTMAVAELRALLPSLLAYHRWWYRDRDPHQTGLVVSFHPWESGMDNSPAWDAALDRVPRVSREYHRRDLEHVDSDQRPLQAQYDRYLYLVDCFKERQFDSQAIFAHCPYRIQDIGIISILHRGTLDLIDLSEEYLPEEDLSDLYAALKRTVAALPQLWSDDRQAYVNRDMVSNELIHIVTSGCVLPLYGKILSKDQARTMAGHIDRWIAKQPCGLSSTHPDEPAFDPKRYWQGPSWLHINWLIANGLDYYGEIATRDTLVAASRRIIDDHGYWEYYNPLNGEGYGGPNFSWTAAIALYWLLDSESAS